MATFNANYREIGKMLTSEWMRAEMLRRAHAVEQVAKAAAPVDESGPHPGRYRESIHTRSYIREPGRGGRTARAVARVEATAPESLYVEFGTRHQEAHATLRRALDAART